MKQFNLTEYLENPSLKVVTRDGRQVRILCTDANGTYPIAALVRREDNEDSACTFKEDGTFLEGVKSERDLFFVPEKKIAWANLYCTELGTMFTGEFSKQKKPRFKKRSKTYVNISQPSRLNGRNDYETI